MTDDADQVEDATEGPEISDAVTHRTVPLIRLSDKYQLSRDALQWIVQRRRGHDTKTGREYWEGIIFVRHDRKLLIDRMEESGVQITPQAWLEVRALPEQFVPTA